MHPKRFLSLWYVCCKLCTYLALTLTLSLMDQNKIAHDPRHLGVSSGASKMISEPVVRSVQIVLLFCVKIRNISKQTESSIHLSLVS
jgi:hypothetical protein